MLLEFIANYAVVMLALVLAFGAINIYYFLDLVLQKENRKNLYNVWFLALFSIAVHSVGHLSEAVLGNIPLYQILEVLSLSIGALVIGLLAKNTLSFYTFVETKRRLETAIQERTMALEEAKTRLEEYSRSLEKRVKERTRELEEAKAGLETRVNERTRELEESVIELTDSRAAILNMVEDMEASRDELRAAYDELKTLDKMKDEFFSNVSHELRTPLTSIKGALDLLEGDGILEEQKELVSLAKKNANRLNALIGDILYYARMAYSDYKLNKEELDLGELIGISVKAVLPTAMDSSVAVETNIEGDLKIFADKNGMHKVLSNLLNNAVKFNNRGGKVVVSARGEKDARIRLSVSDTGIGIPKEHLDKIFTKFYQVDGSTKRRYPGTGLGLAMVKGIVEKHGGRIWVESKVGEGSKFAIELPGIAEKVTADR